MAIIGIDFMWYDAFFMAMLAISASISYVYYPLHIWTVVDYATVFVSRLLMIVDNAVSAGMGLDRSWQQRHARFCARLTVIAVLGLVLYPFLCAWSIIGTFWFIHSKSCASLLTLLIFPNNCLKVAFVIWLLFTYCALFAVICICIAKREAVEARIQQLPKIELRAVSSDCSECSICLEEFHVGNEVDLPCAHNFHTECIDRWHRLNIKCPRCRCSAFPNLDTSAIIQRATHIFRLQSLLRPSRSEAEQVGSIIDEGNLIETPASEGLVNVGRDPGVVGIIQVAAGGSSHSPS